MIQTEGVFARRLSLAREERELAERKRFALDEAIHEVADIVVNFGGYAEDPDEANARGDRRDKLEVELRSLVFNQDQ